MAQLFKNGLFALLCAAVLVFGSLAIATSADAATKKKTASVSSTKTTAKKSIARRAAPTLAAAGAAAAYAKANDDRYADLVIDAGTGKVLHETNADAIRHPASLTKMMTLYMIFSALESGKLKLQQPLPVSREASIQSPSKLGLRAGDSITVENVILGLVTRSANDAAVVAAEAIAGDEDRFANMMTQTARQIGMSSTVYKNPNGLPDPRQVTTARDMARLGLALLKHYPQYYHYFSVASFVYKGEVVTNHNRLMASYPGMDGFKTGFINASGFNLVTSAKQNGRRLIGVIFGGTSAPSRDAQMARLLDASFAGVASDDRPRVQMAAAAPAPEPVALQKDIAAVAQKVKDDYAPPVVPPVVTKAEVTSHDEDIRQEVAAAAQEEAPQAAAPAAIEAHVAKVAAALQEPAKAEPAKMEMAKAEPVKTEAAPSPLLQQASLSAGKLQAPVAEPANENKKVVKAESAAVNHWGIQVGAYNDRASGQRATALVADSMPELLHKASSKVLAVTTGSGTIYRARLVGLSEQDARAACRSLQGKGRPCLTLPPSGSGSAWLASAE